MEEEAGEEGEAAKGVDVACVAEEEAAEEEEKDGGEGLEPGVGLGEGLVGGAEGEDYGVAWEVIRMEIHRAYTGWTGDWPDSAAIS